MAISSKASYIPTSNEFIAHWASVNAFLPPAAPMVLPEVPGKIVAGFNQSGLIVLKQALQDQLDVVQDKLNDVEIARGAVKLQKAALMAKLALFLEVVDGYYSATSFFEARPLMPGEGEGEEHFLKPMKDAKSLWLKLNAAPVPAGLTLPITLQGGTTQAAFVTLVAGLQGAYDSLSQAEQNLKLARATRDKLMRDIYAVLLSYRQAVLPRIAGNQPLIDTLPRLTPEPGHTPQPVDASAVFQAPNQSKVVHSESDDADFKEYQYRGAVGADADAEDAVVIGTHTGRTPQEFVTSFGLTQPGAQVSLWVYVITNDGNERGSPRMVVTRPA
jgi:hypothetical protein